MIPFAVVGSDHEYQVNGKRILGRKTKWGTIEGMAAGPPPIALWVPVPCKDAGCGIHPKCTRVPEPNDFVRLCYFVPGTEGWGSGLSWGPAPQVGWLQDFSLLSAFPPFLEGRMGKSGAAWKLQTHFVPCDQCGQMASQRSRKLRL